MDKCIYKGVDIFNPIAGKMKYFVDAFTAIYGEQYRSVIEKRLKDANYYFLGGKFSNIILKYQDLEKEEIKKVEESPEISDSLKKLKKKDIHERYQLIINIFQNTQKQMDITTIKYSNATNDLIIKKLNHIRKKNNLPPLSNVEAQKSANTYLELLTLGQKEIQNRKSFMSDSKKEEYQKFFLTAGYNEKNLDAYLKNKNIIKNIFDSYFIFQINELNKLKLSELNKLNFCVADLKFHLDKLDIYGGSDDFVKMGSQFIQNTTDNSAFVVNCVTWKSEFKSLCFCKNALDLSIEDLVHEMGHIIDAFVVESGKDGFYYKSGFELHFNGYTYDSYKKSGVPEAGSKNYRHNELFNEMVNEFISLKVAKELEKTGKTFTFKDRKNSAMIKYAFGFEIFEDFLEKYQDKLIELKLKIDKTESAYEYFGEDNFRKLTSLAKEYIETRTELNRQCCIGNKDAYALIDKYREEIKTQIKELERKIERHIAKNNEKNNEVTRKNDNEKESNISKTEASNVENKSKMRHINTLFKNILNPSKIDKSSEKSQSNPEEESMLNK